MIRATWVVGVVATAALTGRAQADGYAVEAQATTLLGTANAGKATLADGATILFANPAGLARVRSSNLRFSLTGLQLAQHFQDEGSTSLLGDPATGARSQDGIRPAYVPAIAASMPITDHVVLGIGIQSQFGLVTDWGDTWVGRYHATRSELFTLNVNPAVAWQVNEHVSLGLGLGIQYGRGELANRIDFGSIAVATLGPDVAAALDLSSQQNDGTITVDGHDVDVGPTLGAEWRVSSHTRFGLGYRGQIQHHLRGDADFDVPAEALPLTSTGQFADTRATTHILTPAVASLGAHHDFNPRWAIVADATWVNWSAVEELAVTFDDPVQAPVASPADWHDTVRLSAGVIHKPNDEWTVRGGFAYAPSPVPDRTRNARLADSDRLWFAGGASWAASKAVSIDFAYVYVRQDDAPIDFTSPLAGRIAGNVDWNVHVISFGVSSRF